MKPSESKKSLTNGTTCISSSLSSVEICNIIKACSECGVATLTFQDLSISFHSKLPLAPNGEIKTEGGQQNPPLPVPVKPNSEVKISESQHEEINKATLEEEERALREEQIAELHITNPLAAEEMIMNEELEYDDGEHGDE